MIFEDTKRSVSKFESELRPSCVLKLSRQNIPHYAITGKRSLDISALELIDEFNLDRKQ